MAVGRRQADDRHAGATPLRNSKPSGKGSFIDQTGRQVWTWDTWDLRWVSLVHASRREVAAAPDDPALPLLKRTWEVNWYPDGWPHPGTGLTPSLFADWPDGTAFYGFTAGFPFRSGRAGLFVMPGLPTGTTTAFGHPLKDAVASQHLGGVLPTSLLWKGVLGNVLVYGGGLFVVWQAAAATRSRKARRRGACAACGYDLRGLRVCPECGTAGGRGA